MATFDAETLARLDAAETVRIQTVDRHDRDGALRSTIIWIVVDDQDVFVRSVRGNRGRWYRDLQADPHAVVVAHRDRWPAVDVEAVPADDPSIERCTGALERKYAEDPALASMLRPETLATTLRLVPTSDWPAG